MKAKLWMTACLVMTASHAVAEHQAFEGFDAAINLSSSVRMAKFSTTDGNLFTVGKPSILPSIEAGYMHSVSHDVLLGMSALYDGLSTRSAPEIELGLKYLHHYGLNLKPAYVVGNAMMYALLGAHTITGKYSSSEGIGGHVSYTGMGAGAGVAAMVAENIYLKAEVQQISYSTKLASSGLWVKPSATLGTLGVGYTFDF